MPVRIGLPNEIREKAEPKISSRGYVEGEAAITFYNIAARSDA
jgi:hypothetical protein